MEISRLLNGAAPLFWRGEPIVVSDGAMATLLHMSGVSVRSCSEELNISTPEHIEAIHQAYVAAGANVIQTNTFAANRSSLERYGLGDRVRDINTAGASLALRAADGKAAVYGTIGAIAGIRMYGAQLDPDDRAALRAQFVEQAEALLELPIHGLLLETFPDLEEMLVALDTVRKMTELPIVANLSPEEVGVTRDGCPLHDAFSRMRSAGATVVGLNCRLSPNGILRSYEKVRPEPTALYAAVPNAGLLHRTDDDYSYTGNATYFADVMEQLLDIGVRWIGGCCGTTPAYIRTVVERIRRSDAQERTRVVEAVRPANLTNRPRAEVSVATPPAPVLSDRAPTLVDQVRRQTTVIVELDPPKTLDCSRYLEAAEGLRQAGANFVTLADNSLGSIRVSNMALGSLLKQRGIDPLVHVACRDRNLIGQQSHLMGLSVLGLHHVLLVTGDPSKFGDLPGATSVYDVSSIELTKMVRRLNEGVGFSGQPLRRPAEFVIGTSFNPHIRNFDKALERLRRKVDAGADYIMTQPVFDERLMERIANAGESIGIPIFLGVMPLTSARNALFLHNEVPGIEIPEQILHAMHHAPPEDGPKAGLEIASRLTEKVLSYFRGIYFITPFLRHDLVIPLIRQASAGK